MTHQGIRIPTDEKLAISDQLEADIEAVIAPLVAAQEAQGACPCCIGRVVAGAMVKLMGYHAAAAIGDGVDVANYIDLVMAGITLGMARRMVAAAGIDEDGADLADLRTEGRPS